MSIELRLPLFAANWMITTALVLLLAYREFGITIQVFCGPTRLQDHEFPDYLQITIALINTMQEGPICLLNSINYLP